MASTTPNIGLTIPTGTEHVSRQIINDNNTIIDGKMGEVPNGQNLQGEIDALNGNIAKKIPFYSYTIANDFPTTTNIQNFFNIETEVTGIFAIGFRNDNAIRSTLYYSAVNNKYGAGILVSYYGDRFAKVVNTNGTVTITNF